MVAVVKGRFRHGVRLKLLNEFNIGHGRVHFSFLCPSRSPAPQQHKSPDCPRCTPRATGESESQKRKPPPAATLLESQSSESAEECIRRSRPIPGSGG